MSLSLKPTHATVKAYYETLHQFGQLYIDHEGAVRSAFQHCSPNADNAPLPNSPSFPSTASSSQKQFRSHYHDPSITKWDIFHYVYAVLHHPIGAPEGR